MKNSTKNAIFMAVNNNSQQGGKSCICGRIFFFHYFILLQVKGVHWKYQRKNYEHTENLVKIVEIALQKKKEKTNIHQINARPKINKPQQSQQKEIN